MLRTQPTTVFWAVKVQQRPHMCDVWAFGLTGLAVFMAVHQAYYSAAHHLELFNVRTSMLAVMLKQANDHRSSVLPPTHPR